MIYYVSLLSCVPTLFFITIFKLGNIPKDVFFILSVNVNKCLEKSKIKNGLCSLFVKHTSASLLIQENADPAVLRDIESFFRRLVSEDSNLYEHNSEGPDDMPAHIRSLLTNTSLSIPITNSKLELGIWQGIYLYEHRNQSYTRKVIVNIIGE